MSSQLITPQKILPPQAIQNQISKSQPLTSEPNPIKRRSDGTFTPGSIPNPLGRPKTAHVTEALREMLASGDAEKIAKVLRAKALKNGKHQPWAIDTILDRVEGKAVQQINMTATVIDPDTARRLVELAERMVDL